MNRKLVKKDRGKRFTIYIKSDVSQNLIEWINSQKEPSKSIRSVIEKYANGELIDAKLLLEKNSSYNENYMKNYQGNIEEKPLKTNDESSYELEKKEEEISSEKSEKRLSKKRNNKHSKDCKIKNNKSKNKRRKYNHPIISLLVLDIRLKRENNRKKIIL